MTMAKGTKGIIGQYTSTRGLLSWAVGAGLTILAYNKLRKDADDPSKRGTWSTKVAGLLGMKGAGVES